MGRAALLGILLIAVTHDPPSPQIVLPCKVISVHDGDTVTVEVTVRANVRLLDCWAPELREPGGKESQIEAERFAKGKSGLLTVPLGQHLGESLSLGRVLGRITIDGEDMSEHIVRLKHATKQKGQ